jgi:diaminopimelate epimerase
MKFYKYHALGNDYIVINPNDIDKELSTSQIKLICHRNYGIGSDGILFGPIKTDKADFSLRIFNPDGSEAEKSGNGLRIFSRYLWDNGLVIDKPFSILTKGGIVKSHVYSNGRLVNVEMGKVSFESTMIPITGNPREVLNENIIINDQKFLYCAATIGNPHCVILLDQISVEMVKKYGPIIENDSRFPNRTNVQFMKIIDRNNIQIEIWERGAGYTLASGSSSSAAAAVAHKLDMCNSQIAVHMPGGILDITILQNYEIIMTGPVIKVAEGTISNDLFIKKF